jgi:FkbM family methyltransferase
MTRPIASLMKTILGWFDWSVERVDRDVLFVHSDGEESQRQDALWTFLAERHRALLLDRLKIDCVVDVGANLGSFALGLRHGGWRGAIHSFEPQSSCVSTLNRLATGDSHWAIYPVALSDVEGTARMDLRASSELTSLQVPRLDSRIASLSGFAELLAVIGHEDIAIRRLDAVLSELPDRGGKRLFLKIDAQGHDEAVLAGAASVLDRIVAIQLELTQDALYEGTANYLDVARQLAQNGYILNAVFPVARDPSGQALLEFDGIFVRVDPS